MKILKYKIEDEIMDTVTYYYSDKSYKVVNINEELIEEGKIKTNDIDHDSPYNGD